MSWKKLKERAKLWMCRKSGVVPPNPAYFVWLCKNGSVKEIAKAAVNGADVNALFQGSISGLMYAIANRRENAVIEIILRAGCNPNLQGASGETALMIACARGCGAEAITMLLEYGADTKIKTNDGATAIDFARDAKNEAAENALEEFSKKENS